MDREMNKLEVMFEFRAINNACPGRIGLHKSCSKIYITCDAVFGTPKIKIVGGIRYKTPLRSIHTKGYGLSAGILVTEKLTITPAQERARI